MEKSSIDVPTSKSIATAHSKIVIHLRMRIRMFLHLGPLVEVNHPRGNDSLVDNLVLGLLCLSLSISRCLARSLSLALARFVFRSLSRTSISFFSFHLLV